MAPHCFTSIYIFTFYIYSFWNFYKASLHLQMHFTPYVPPFWGCVSITTALPCTDLLGSYCAASFQFLSILLCFLDGLVKACVQLVFFFKAFRSTLLCCCLCQQPTSSEKSKGNLGLNICPWLIYPEESSLDSTAFKLALNFFCSTWTTSRSWNWRQPLVVTVNNKFKILMSKLEGVSPDSEPFSLSTC